MRIHHVALRVADCQRAAAFYGGVLGLPEMRRFEESGRLRAVWLGLDQGVLMLETSLRGQSAESGSGHVLAFAVDDLPAWEQRLSAAGIAITDRTAHTLFANDPDGHRVAFSIFPL